MTIKWSALIPTSCLFGLLLGVCLFRRRSIGEEFVEVPVSVLDGTVDVDFIGLDL